MNYNIIVKPSFEREAKRLRKHYASFKDLSDELEKRNISLKKAGLEYIATSPISLNEEELSEIEKLLDKLEEDDDVQNVYTNIQ